MLDILIVTLLVTLFVLGLFGLVQWVLSFFPRINPARLQPAGYVAGRLENAFLRWPHGQAIRRVGMTGAELHHLANLTQRKPNVRFIEVRL